MIVGWEGLTTGDGCYFLWFFRVKLRLLDVIICWMRCITADHAGSRQIRDDVPPLPRRVSAIMIQTQSRAKWISIPTAQRKMGWMSMESSPEGGQWKTWWEIHQGSAFSWPPVPTPEDIGMKRPIKLPCVLEATVGGAVRNHRFVLMKTLKRSFLIRPEVSLPGGGLLSPLGVSRPDMIVNGIEPKRDRDVRPSWRGRLFGARLWLGAAFESDVSDTAGRCVLAERL